MIGWKNGSDIDEFMFGEITLVTSWGITCRWTLLGEEASMRDPETQHHL